MTIGENPGRIERGRNLTSELRLEADVAVIGSGAGGSMVAAELSRAGAKVVVLEEGPALTQWDMTQREIEMLPKLYQERGARSTSDFAIRVMGGRNIGGSTVHNISLCKRPPNEILEQWSSHFKVSGCSPRDLESIFATVESELSVSEIPETERNRNNQILASGVAALGWAGGPLAHNRVGCNGSGFCEIGCPYDAKQNAAKVLIPRALNAGARVFSDVLAYRIDHANRSVRGVEGWALDQWGGRGPMVRVTAPHVVLAGSAIGSAGVALRSNLPDPYALLGRGLQLHPGVAVVGYFEDKVDGFRGVPQSYECTEWLDFGRESQKRIWITTAMAHPIGASTMIPGFGKKHRHWMLRYSHLAALTAMVHDQSRGRVRLQAGGRPRIDYTLGAEDSEQLALGMRASARLLLAAGAKEVLIPSIPSLTLKSAAEINALDQSIAAPHHTPITAVHPMSTLPFGDDQRIAVFGSQGEHHQVSGLHACDSSIFPCGVGVPPQITVYSLARHLSRFIEEKAGRG